ncbi:restriction endonuclease subunit S [Aliarcobacter butzleri]|uniref:restriction endonuclease subunit S n=1 Tax=Aliarcobacter butzleri TaxID=28197 RepID=UPI0021B497B3|nr:restriction endonuclease subunit S [Aliarcobacter butzleri]MCT7595199.1 restriction endonuclease subunit S [Aliarcobacter butzleri]MCT7599892.1 restriction endonuclease subunit S [Aliarcobacter butzleri]
MSEIKQGYKQTKVGIIPEDWEVVKVGEKFDFLKTYSNSREDLNNQDDISYIHYGEIHTKHKFYIDFAKFELPKINKSKLPNEIIFAQNGDLVIADASEDYADIGKSAEIKNLTSKAVSGLHTFLLRDKNNNFVDGYKGYLLYNEIVARSIKKIATGISVLGISKTNLSNLYIPLPPLKEQEKIAEILTTWDEAITKQTELLRAKELLKIALMQKLLSGEVRFSGFSDEWEEVKIKDIFEITRGYVLAVTEMSQEQTAEYKYPVYSSQTKNNGLTGYYKDYLFENCITWTTDGANAGDVNLRKGKFYCTNVCGVLKSDKGYANQCIAEILNLVTKNYVSYVGNPKLMNNTMGGIKIKIPKSLPEQQKIAEVLSLADDETNLLKNELEELKLQKKALMQKLLTGEVRVKV